MSDYISREAAIELGYWHGEKPTVGNPFPDGVDAVDTVDIENLPAADVREVRRKPVVGYESLYFISDDGEVTNADGLTMKQYTKQGHGTSYKKVALYKDGEYKHKYVHRLVAEAFLPNPQGLPMINHKDEDGTNNRLNNLEWCTHLYNMNYGTAKERMREKKVGRTQTEEHNKKIAAAMRKYHETSPVRRSVYCLETDTVYESISEAARELGINESVIRMSCERETQKGRKYTFRYFCPNCGAYMRLTAEELTTGHLHLGEVKNGD